MSPFSLCFLPLVAAVALHFCELYPRAFGLYLNPALSSLVPRALGRPNPLFSLSLRLPSLLAHTTTFITSLPMHFTVLTVHLSILD